MRERREGDRRAEEELQLTMEAQPRSKERKRRERGEGKGAPECSVSKHCVSASSGHTALAEYSVPEGKRRKSRTERVGNKEGKESRQPATAHSAQCVLCPPPAPASESAAAKHPYHTFC